MLASNLHINPPVAPSLPVADTATYSPDEVPSCGGHGTFEILAITRFLEEHGIECCIVGVSALIYYGAGRVRDVCSLLMLQTDFSPRLTKDFCIGMGSLRPRHQSQRSCCSSFLRTYIRQDSPCTSTLDLTSLLARPYLPPIQREGNSFLFCPYARPRRSHSFRSLPNTTQLNRPTISHIANLNAKLPGHE
jgi:hypothetical protein